jgi:hypothetical protein
MAVRNSCLRINSGRLQGRGMPLAALICAAKLCPSLASPAQQEPPAPSAEPKPRPWADASHPRPSITADKALTPSTHQTKPSQDQNFLLAAMLTGDVREDEPALATLQHAMLSARLGEAWIKVDAGTARHQLRSAVRAMELQAQNGDPGTAAQRAETVRILLKIYASFE